ncbi:MAG: hypothetical protein RLZZ272_1170 [Actinomycetota bacterium]
MIVDHDGTLSPIVRDPSAAALEVGAEDALERLAPRAPVVVLSGRGLDDLRARLGHLPVLIGANHGGTLVDRCGEVRWLVDPVPVATALDTLEHRLRALLTTDDGWLVERKDLSVTVHHRRVGADGRARTLPAVRAVLGEVASAHPGLEVLEGRAVLELRAADANKGRALREVLRAHPGRVPLAIGDDVTDEDMFRTALGLGGHAVLVDGSSHESVATARLADPAAVVALLVALADDVRRG